jgi:hypothetical protein
MTDQPREGAGVADQGRVRSWRIRPSVGRVTMLAILPMPRERLLCSTSSSSTEWPVAGTERRQVPAEVQFEVARNAVTHTADSGTARQPTGPGQGREERVVARLELGSMLSGGLPK